jgi:hypothetical protein
MSNNSENSNWYKLSPLTKDELKQFINDSLQGKYKQPKIAYIGDVCTDAALRISDLCGEIVSKIRIDSGTIRHAHGKKTHNLLQDDILCCADVINTATDVTVSDEYHLNNTVLEFRKEINGLITFITEVLVNYGGWLSLVTCYRQKKAKI